MQVRGNDFGAAAGTRPRSRFPRNSSGAPGGAPVLLTCAALTPRSVPDLDPRPDPGTQPRVGVVGAQPAVQFAARIDAGASAFAVNHGHLAVRLGQPLRH